MKQIFLSLLLLFVLINIDELRSQSQSQPQFNPVELEFSFGVPFGMSMPKHGSLDGGLSFSFETRYNLSPIPLSAGFQYYSTSWEIVIPPAGEGKSYKYSNRVLIIAFDYNFDNIHRSLRPFAGAGIGYGTIISDASYIDVGKSDSYPYFTPRVGLEAWSRLRFTFAYHITKKSNSNFVCMLGFVIGGGRKKSNKQTKNYIQTENKKSKKWFKNVQISPISK